MPNSNADRQQNPEVYSENQSMHLAEIPHPVLTELFTFLSYQDLGKVELVNKKFQKAINKPYLWTQVLDNEFPNPRRNQGNLTDTVEDVKMTIKNIIGWPRMPWIPC